MAMMETVHPKAVSSDEACAVIGGPDREMVEERDMQSDLVESAVYVARASRKGYWAGWVVSGLVTLFLTFDAVLKFTHIPAVSEAFAKLGFPASLAVPIGVLLLACTALYAIPRTAVLGAVLLTGYLGGAISIHLRVGDPLFSYVLVPAYFGALLWGGIFLREPRLRELLPLRK